MVIGALGLLVGLGFADEDKYMLMPSLFNNARVGILPKGEADEDRIHSTIYRFNRGLSQAYLMLDPSPLASLPMDETLRRSYIDELDFLRRGGRAMEMTLTEFRVEEIRRLANDQLSVRTTELIDLRYLTARERTQIMSYPKTRYVMSYLLEPFGSGWKILAAQTLAVGTPGG